MNARPPCPARQTRVRDTTWAAWHWLTLATTLAIGLSLGLALPAAPAHAHEYRPAVLVLSAEPSTRAEHATIGELRFAPGTGDAADVRFAFDDGCAVHLDRLRCEPDSPLAISLVDPFGEQELVVELVDREGSSATVVLTPDRPRALLGSLDTARAHRDEPVQDGSGEAPATRWARSPFVHWLASGIEHVWTGLDHLAFILGLWFVATSLRARIYAVTAFTVGHSVTLALAVLGGLSLPTGPVESLIALSVVLLAREGLLAGKATLATATRAREHVDGPVDPRAVAMWGVVFGLLHGLGFASALLAAGLGAEGRALGLLAFNLGVELGQLAFLLACSGLAALAVAALHLTVQTRGHVRSTLVWLLGVLAATWFVERTTSVLLGVLSSR